MAVIRSVVAAVAMLASIYVSALPKYTHYGTSGVELLASNPLGAISRLQPLGLLQGPVSGPVNYTYDELGRLIAAVDAAGNAAVYSYDAVGNILAITRYTSGQFAFFSFSPKSGPVGTTVNVFGANFSSDPAQDSVMFNGVTANIISATATKLVVSVPAGATSGTLAISSPAGSVTTTDSFTVTSSNGVPRIDSFTPQIAAAASAINLAGANFDLAPANDRLILNVTPVALPTGVSASSMTMSVPAGAGSGHISLSTPAGNVITTGDLFVPPSGFTPAQVGYTGRTALGAATTASIATANKIGLLLFEGTAGHSVSVTSASPSFSNCTFQIYKPDNTALSGSGASCAAASFLDSQKLPVSGTYALLINASAGSAGAATFTIYDSSDITATLVPGGPPYTLTTTVPGQNARLTFIGNSHVSLTLSNSTFTGCSVTVYNPDPTVLTTLGCTSSTTFGEVPYLPEPGKYTILIDPTGSQTGTLTVKLNDATDVTGPIATDGTAFTATTTVPGQNAKLTFAGSAGQLVTAILDTNSYASQVALTVLAPDGSQVETASSSGSFFLEDTQYCFNGSVLYVCGSFILPTTGTYTLFLNPPLAITGHARLRLYTFASDATYSSSLGGAQVPVVISTPGQNGRITFSGTQGQRLSVGFANASFSGTITPSINYELLKPDGTLFAGPSSGGPFNFATSTASGFIDWGDIYTFPSTGTYTLIVDPAGDVTGSVNLNLYNATDTTVNATADGTVYSVSTTSPGQNVHVNFTPSIGQRISARATNISYQSQMPSLTLRRVDANGNVSNVAFGTTDGSNLFMDTVTIAQSGSYFMFLDPAAQTVGSASVAIYTVNDLTGTMDTAGTQVTIATTVPGQNANYTFSGTSGQTVTWAANGVTYPSAACQIKIMLPNGSLLASNDCFNGTGSWSQNVPLTQTGTYTMTVDPSKSTTGSMNVSLTAH
jgi:YD repeat-containing protein